jgi:hypothetical protein
MRKKYLIMSYLGPLDGWCVVDYVSEAESYAAGSVRGQDDGFDDFEYAKKTYECIQNINDNDPLILVEVLVDNGVEQEYK